MNTRHGLIYLCSSALLIANSAMAAEQLEEVTVTVTRMASPLESLAASASVVNKDDVQDGKQQLGVDESLVAVPGLFLQNRYNFAQDTRVAIRGFGARSSFGIRGVKILVDGIPETLPDGQGNIDSIDIGSIDRIAVLRGPSSALYGNAAGGAIVIESEGAPERPFIDIRPSAGSDGFQKHQFKAGGQVDRLDYLVNLSRLDYDGYRDNSATELQSFNGKVNYRINDDTTFRTVLNHTDSPKAEDPGGVDLETFENDPEAARDRNLALRTGEEMEQTRLGFVYRREFSGNELQVRNYYTWKDFTGRIPVAGSGAIAFDRFVYGGGIQYTHSAEVAGRPNRLTVGLDVDLQDDDRTRRANDQGVPGALALDQHERVHSIGVFVSNELLLSEPLTVTAGVRFDQVSFDVDDNFLSDGDDSGDRTLDQISPSLGLHYQVNDNWNAFAQVSTGFQTPTTTEFANPNGGGFNPDLEPEQSTNMEVGVKGKLNNRVNVELAVFTIQIDDELIPFELDGRDFFENAGSSKRSGLELTIRAEPVAGLQANLAYTLNDFEFDDFESGDDDFSGNTTPGIPDHTLHLGLTYTHPSNTYAKLDWLLVGDLYADNANTVKVDGYHVGNLQIGHKLRGKHWRFEPFLGINNLSDEHYPGNIRINAFGGRYYEAAPERNVFAGFTLGHDF